MKQKKVEQFSSGGGGHAQNFIDAMHPRKKERLKAEIEEIHDSSAWCHFGDISCQLGAAHAREAAEAEVRNFRPWNDVPDDSHTHLEANKIDTAQENNPLVPVLGTDAEKKQTMVGETATPEALAKLTRQHHEGFAVLETIYH